MVQDSAIGDKLLLLREQTLEECLLVSRWGHLCRTKLGNLSKGWMSLGGDRVRDYVVLVDRRLENLFLSLWCWNPCTGNLLCGFVNTLNCTSLAGLKFMEGATPELSPHRETTKDNGVGTWNCQNTNRKKAINIWPQIIYSLHVWFWFV